MKVVPTINGQPKEEVATVAVVATPSSIGPSPAQTMNANALLAQGDFHSLLLAQWHNIPYGELAVVVSWLKALAAMHQSHHWQASADPFYGDHLLYERLYDSVVKSVDRVAEKSVGMGCSDLADPSRLIKYSGAVLEAMYLVRPGIPQASDLVVRALYVEKEYLKMLQAMSDSLESKGLLTMGVDNMLAELADQAEERVYLLKQRLAF